MTIGTATRQPLVSCIALLMVGTAVACCGQREGSQNVGHWPVTIGGDAAFCTPKALRTDHLGNVYLLGLCGGTVDFDFGPSSEICRSDYEKLTSFISKYDNFGSYQWHHCFSHGDQELLVNDIACDGQGNVYAAGGRNAVSSARQDSDTDTSAQAVLMKLASNGQVEWEATWGAQSLGQGICEGKALALSSSGDICVAGIYGGEVDFDPNPGVHVRTSNGATDCFLCRFSSLGELVWVRTWGGSSRFESVESLSVDSDQDIYLTGSFSMSRPLVFDSGATILPEFEGQTRGAYLLKTDRDGNLAWIRQWGGTNIEDYCSGVSVLASGADAVFVLGEFSGTVQLTSAGKSDILTSNGFMDIFLACFDSLGSPQWARAWGGPLRDEACCMFLDGLGNIYCSGSYKVAVDFDPGIVGTITYCSSVSTFDSDGMFKHVDSWLGGGGIRGAVYGNKVYLCRRRTDRDGWGSRYEQNPDAVERVECIILEEELADQ